MGVFPVIESESPLALASWLSELLDKPLRLRFTANRSTMISWRDEGGILSLRIHKMFADAPEAIWISLAHYLTYEDKASGKIVDGYIEEHASKFAKPASPRRPIGKFHDLLQLFDALNTRFFHQRCGAQITWGRATSLRSRRSIQLGSYDKTQELIRIHPCLDQAFVPHYYVAWVIYHEMLHEVLGEEIVNGRRCVHSAEFRILEESYPDFERCKQWEAKHINRLLRYRPSDSRV